VAVITEPGYRRELFGTTIGAWYWFGFILIRLGLADLHDKHPPMLAVVADVITFSMLLWSLYRPWHMGVRLGDRGVTVRNYLRTRRATWAEVRALADGTSDGSQWRLSVTLKDGRCITAAATQAQRGSPPVLMAVRQAAVRYGVETAVSGIPPERPGTCLGPGPEGKRERGRLTWYIAATVSTAVGTVLLIWWGTTHGSHYSPAALAGVAAVICLMCALGLAIDNRKRQAVPTPDRGREGEWFAVPLPKSAGFAPGLVARAEARNDGIMLCYFFAPQGTGEPALDQLLELRPADAVLVQKLDGLGKDWARLGRAADWALSAWPVPAFRDSSKAKGQAVKFGYDDGLGFVGAEVSSDAELENLAANEVLRASGTATALANLLKAHPAVTAARTAAAPSPRR